MSALLKFPEVERKQHALKIEDLEMNVFYASQIVDEMKNFLGKLKLNDDRIEAISCRSCDGFFPYSHNKGGLEGYSFRDHYSVYIENSGFPNTDLVAERYYNNSLKDYAKDQGLTKEDILDNEEQRDIFEQEYQESDDTVEFKCRLMLNSDSELTVSFFISASDTPYHRSYDDILEYEVKFKSISGLKQKLARILNKKEVKTFSKNVRQGF